MIVVAVLCGRAASADEPADASAPPAATEMPLPRFGSLKTSPVNMRQGPGTEYPAAWVYRRAGLPVEIIKEYEGWRQVRDAQGATGWVLQLFLSRRRTALVLPWEVKDGSTPPIVVLHASDSERAKVVANIEAGVIADVNGCDGRWCKVSVEQLQGYIEQKKLWGVYPDEIVK